MTRALLALALLSGCASSPKPGPWVVAATVDAATAAQALDLVEATKQAMGPSPLEYGGTIRLMPEVATLCYGPMAAGEPIAGCTVDGGVFVLWPHPKHPGCLDLAQCSALVHELCHVAQGYRTSEATVGACELLVAQEYRRQSP